MLVRELIEQLKQFDPELPVELWFPSENTLEDVEEVKLSKPGESFYPGGAVHIHAKE